MKKLMAAFHNFTKAPKNHTFYVVYLCVILLQSSEFILILTVTVRNKNCEPPACDRDFITFFSG